MIGEFCPKVPALRIHPALRLKTWIVEFDAEASAWTVISPGKCRLCSQQKVVDDHIAGFLLSPLVSII